MQSKCLLGLVTVTFFYFGLSVMAASNAGWT
jgi:hypothetical protein